MLLRSEWEGREEQQWILRPDVFFPNVGHFNQPPSSIYPSPSGFHKDTEKDVSSSNSELM